MTESIKSEVQTNLPTDNTKYAKGPGAATPPSIVPTENPAEISCGNLKADTGFTNITALLNPTDGPCMRSLVQIIVNSNCYRPSVGHHVCGRKLYQNHHLGISIHLPNKKDHSFCEPFKCISISLTLCDAETFLDKRTYIDKDNAPILPKRVKTDKTHPHNCQESIPECEEDRGPKIITGTKREKEWGHGETKPIFTVSHCSVDDDFDHANFEAGSCIMESYVQTCTVFGEMPTNIK